MNLCELFVEKGTDINLEDKFGQTCIFYAVRTGHYDIVKFFERIKNHKRRETRKNRLIVPDNMVPNN